MNMAMRRGEEDHVIMLARRFVMAKTAVAQHAAMHELRNAVLAETLACGNKTRNGLFCIKLALFGLLRNTHFCSNELIVSINSELIKYDKKLTGKFERQARGLVGNNGFIPPEPAQVASPYGTSSPVQVIHYIAPNTPPLTMLSYDKVFMGIRRHALKSLQAYVESVDPVVRIDEIPLRLLGQGYLYLELEGKEREKQIYENLQIRIREAVSLNQNNADSLAGALIHILHQEGISPKIPSGVRYEYSYSDQCLVQEFAL